jgi:hypothetical protein
MESLELFDEVGYVEPKAEEKAALIAKLQSGDYTLSFSSLVAFAVSPAYFIAYKLQETKNTDAMLLGDVSHCYIFEPGKIRERYHVMPDVDATTVEGKNAWAKVYMDYTGREVPSNKNGNFQPPKKADIIAEIKAATGTTILPFKVDENAKFRARKVINNRACRSVLNQITYTEKAVEWVFCGIKFRGRIDAGGDGIIADLKNMPDATIDKAVGTIWSRRLHWQAFGYNESQGGNNKCHIIAVDGNGETSVHVFHPNHLANAERQMKRYCHEFKRCIVESIFDLSVWDMSQDFWLKTDLNREGINYL